MPSTPENRKKSRERKKQKRAALKAKSFMEHVNMIGDMMDGSQVPTVVESVKTLPGKIKPTDVKNFTEVLRELLNKKRSFKLANGQTVILSQMELIVARAIITLVKDPVFDVRLFSLLMDRIDGKVPDSLVSLNANVGETLGAEARAAVLARVAQIISSQDDISSADETE